MIAQVMLATPLRAQAVVLPKDDILPELEKLQETYDLAFYVNGPLTVGLTDEQRETYYDLGPMHQLLMTLATLRLIDKGRLSLDDSAAAIVPDTLEHDPFKPAITIRHLLTNTGGFAALPSWPIDLPLDQHSWADGSLDRYLIQIRSAGQMPYHDLAGWVLLERVLENATDKSLDEIYLHEILTPLGLEAGSIQRPELIKPSGGLTFQSQVGLKGTGSLFEAVTRLLIRNRSTEGRFLSATAYDSFIQEASWKLHPLAPERILSLQKEYVNGNVMLSFAPHVRSSELAAFPNQGVAFFGRKSGSYKSVQRLAVSLAENIFPKRDGNPEAPLAQQLREPQLLGGLYVADTAPTALLSDRILTTGSNIRITRLPDGNLSLSVKTNDPFHGDQFHIFEKIAPYYYVSNSLPDNPIVFSPKTAGGYYTFSGQTYRYVGLIGDTNLVINPVPWMFLVLFTALIYIPRKLWRKANIDLSWQRLGMFGVGGILLLAFGLYGELIWWPIAVYEMNQPWLVFGWRLVLNIGLMAILTIPLFTLSITKRKVVPSGLLGLAMNLHLVLLTAASLMLFFIMVAWGVAGEFWPY